MDKHSLETKDPQIVHYKVWFISIKERHATINVLNIQEAESFSRATQTQKMGLGICDNDTSLFINGKKETRSLWRFIEKDIQWKEVIFALSPFYCETPKNRIIVVLTDGEENSSVRGSQSEVKGRLKELQDVGSTIHFLLFNSKISLEAISEGYGIPIKNIQSLSTEVDSESIRGLGERVAKDRNDRK